jgi:hypothetical protein
MKIGIDFSIKSPAVTLVNSNDIISFHAFPRKSVAKETFLDALAEAGVNVNVLLDEPPLGKKATLAERERSSLIDAKIEIESILSAIERSKIQDVVSKDFCTSKYEVFLGIEGFSFGSTGNRLAQLSGYQWVLRYLLQERLKIESSNFHVYAPMTVKATAGKGNFKKDDMITAFLSSDDERLQKTGLWQALNNSPENFQNKKGAWLKPLDDIIDSYWVLKTLEKNTVELSQGVCI